MGSQRLVSVIIPAYNNAKTIPATIESLQKQTYEALEIIIVNDGSTDNTLEVVVGIQQKDVRIKIANQKNQGPAEARNHGLAEATGDYVFFVDADDVVEPQAIAHMVEAMERNQAKLVIAAIRRVNIEADGRRRQTDNLATLQAYQGKQDIRATFFTLMEENDVINSMCAKLYRREIIRDYNVVSNPKLFMGEDLQFNLSYMREIDEFYLLPEVVYEYEKFQSLLTSRYHENLFDSRKESVAMLRDFLEHKELSCNLSYYLYLKLVLSQTMQDHAYHVAKKARIAHIEKAIRQSEVQEAMKKFQPEGRMQRLVARATRGGVATRIDRYAYWMGWMRKLFGSRVKRTSV